jgi:diadenosine tetraphosphate (Ap4A) HIT family hydrolase
MVRQVLEQEVYEVLSEECTFCAQFILNSRENYWAQYGQRYDQRTDLIAQSIHCLVVAGIGALAEGYVLILPKRHHLSIAGLTGDEMNDFLRVKGIVRRAMGALYGNIVTFEHGASSCARAGACIDHAHLHLFPSKADFRPFLETAEFKVRLIDHIAELQEYTQTEMGYLYYEDASEQKAVYIPHSPIPSQYFRRIWAQLVGRPYEWDWGLFVFEDNVAHTIDKMRACLPAEL